MMHMSHHNLLLSLREADANPNPNPTSSDKGADEDDNRRTAATLPGLEALGPPDQHIVKMASEITTGPVSPITSADWDCTASFSFFFGTGVETSDVLAPQFPYILPALEHHGTSLSFPPPDMDCRSESMPSAVQQPVAGLEPALYQEALEEFFAKNGAWRPLEPCVHCRRSRLQCFILQTTEANPNPVNSCSSCVALFRSCSLAERSKRGHSQFETAHPVIGHLHGVNEEANHSSWDHSLSISVQPCSTVVPLSSGTSKRSSSRSVRRTQVLRDWFAVNIQHPYPTDEEKMSLAGRSGLSRTQVINWFTNARRRHRLLTQPMLNDRTFRTGSPMPQSSLSHMTPFERWRNSPPDNEPVSEDVIRRAIGSNANTTQEGGSLGNDETMLLPKDDPGSSANTEPILYARSAFCCSSDGSTSNFSTFDSSQVSASSDAVLSGWSSEHRAQPAWVKSASARIKKSKSPTFTCTHCLRGFSKKYDWLRHERSVHTPGDTSWVCAIPLPPEQPHLIWRLGQTQAECIFCGQAMPNEEHMQSHEFESCAKRAVQDRSFTRKDHMWQHLYKFHGCRKWEGWKPDLDLLMNKAGSVLRRTNRNGASIFESE